MLTQFRKLAKRSKTILIAYMIYDDWRRKKLFKAGHIVGSSGAIETEVSDTLGYINRTFDDYLKYSDISIGDLRDKTVLEIGPGDNLGVALKFLAAGARKVVCIDKFLSKCDPKYEHHIYKALRNNLNDYERANIDDAINLRNDRTEINPDRLLYVCGVGIEEGRKLFEPESFEFIVSRAVIQHLYDIDLAFSAMDTLLTHGGYLIHKIDFRDLGMFSSFGFNPLTFLTIPKSVYKLMTYNSGRPNRKLLNYYRQQMHTFGYCTKILVTQIVGTEKEMVPYKETLTAGIDYSDATIACVNEVRPYLVNEFKNMADEELFVAGIFLTAKKP